MKGTEKQIKWAKELKEYAEFIFEQCKSDCVPDLEEITTYWNLIKNIEDSTFWIETKSGLGSDFNPKWSYERGVKKGMIV